MEKRHHVYSFDGYGLFKWATQGQPMGMAGDSRQKHTLETVLVFRLIFFVDFYPRICFPEHNSSQLKNAQTYTKVLPTERHWCRQIKKLKTGDL